MRSADQVGVVLQRESIGPVGLGATAASERLSQSYCFDAKAGPGPETDSHQTPQDLRFGRLQLPTEWNVLRLVGIQLSLGGAPVLYQPLLLDQWKEARISAHGA